MYKFFVHLLTFAILLLACSKKSDTESFDFKLDPVGLKYIQLRQDQYFIYRDSLNSKTDSLVVTQSVISSSTGRWMNKPAKSEVYNLTLTKKTAITDSVWIKGFAEAESNGTMSLLYDPYYFTAYFNYPPGACSFCTKTYRLSSLTVEGKTYFDIIITENPNKHTYYWASSVGLIKVDEEPSGSSPNRPRNTYTLLRHN